MQNLISQTDLMAANPQNIGKVVSVRGSVVDAYFPQRLPSYLNRLDAGEDGSVIIEVVRGIALTPTLGLARESTVVDLGQPLQMPVGRNLLGRMFNVFGNTIDRGAPLTDVTWRSIHQPTIPLSQQSTASQILETGIKVIDVLSPIERGGKAGLFGGTGEMRRKKKQDDALRRTKRVAPTPFSP